MNGSIVSAGAPRIAPDRQAMDDVRSIVRSMTLEQKVGQCFVFGFGGTVLTPDVAGMITELHVGGIRLSPFTTRFQQFSDSDVSGEYVDAPEFRMLRGKKLSTDLAPHYTAAEFTHLLNRMQRLAAGRPLGLPLHFMVDQEGDFSSDYNPGRINLFPSQMGLTSSGDPQNARIAARITAEQLRAAGIHWVNSPVVDVNVHPRNPEIGTRSFGDDPELVARYAAAMIQGFREGRVIASAKHFPGRGDSDTDAHRELPLLDVDRTRLDSCELVPYRSLIAAGLLDVVMAGHILCPRIEPDGLPSTVSPRVLKNLLRDELGYDGLIVSDSMTMKAIISRYSVPDACAMALQAGCDVVLMKAENGWRSQAVHRVGRWVEIGKIPERELDRKVERVLLARLRIGLLPGSPAPDPEKAVGPIVLGENRAAARRIALGAIIVTHDRRNLLPLKRGSRVLLIEQKLTFRTPNNIHHHPRMLYEEMVRHDPSIDYIDIELFPTESDRARVDAALESGSYDAIVMTNLYWRDVPWSDYLVKVAGSDLPIVLVTNTPYEQGLNGEAACAVINFGTNRLGYSALCDVLYGTQKAGGTWPLATIAPPKWTDRDDEKVEGPFLSIDKREPTLQKEAL